MAAISDHAPAQAPGWKRPIINGLIVVSALGGLAWGISTSLDNYRDRVALRGLNGKPTPIDLIVAGEPMTIPANMIRFREERRGGALDQVDLLLHWPSLEGLTNASEEAFKDPSPAAPLIFVSISARDNPLDSTSRLEPLYSRFFVGEPIAGPAGLVGRALSNESGYGGEVIYFTPNAAKPFVARCIAVETPDIPATCIRDVNVGQGLSMLYRFNTAYLAEWRAIDIGLKALAKGLFRNR